MPSGKVGRGGGGAAGDCPPEKGCLSRVSMGEWVPARCTGGEESFLGGGKGGAEARPRVGERPELKGGGRG